MAARGEFTTEYDNHAELIVGDVDFMEPEEAGKESVLSALAADCLHVPV